MRVGSLCTGYGGLDIAVDRALGGEMVWYSEFEKHPSTLLAARFPGIPNIGDLTKIDWASVPEIDILTGGYPCQPFSQAGKRLGEHDPRHLWPHIREAIRVLRPRYSIFENVSGHRSMGFAAVLRDCAEDRLDVRWVSVRASDVGAPHQRERLFFVVTEPAVAGLQREVVRRGRYVPLSERSRQDSSAHAESFGCPSTGRPSEESWASTDGGASTVADSWRLGFERGRTAPRQTERPQPATDRLCPVVWGEYEPAIRRWEQLTRPAPAPTEPNKNGRPRLTAAFDEWMMGLPEGWINDIDIPYGAKIKLCGNGVVPQQAELALSLLLDMERKTYGN